MGTIAEEVRQRVLEENRKHYNSEYADEYDLVHSQGEGHYSQRLVKKQIQEITARFPGVFTVLDFGCGTGNLSLNFLRMSSSCRVTAVDIAQRVLDRLAQRITPEESTRIEFVALDVDSLPEKKPEKIDVLCCSGALHHLPDYVSSVARLVDHVQPKVVYFALEPRPKSRLSKTANALNLIDTRWHFCMVDLKLEGMPFHVRALKLVKSIVAYWLGDSSWVRRLRQLLQRSKFFSQLYYEGKYYSQEESMKYVEYHSEGVDDSALEQILENRGYQVIVHNGADKHYYFFFRLAELFKAPSHFSLVAFKTAQINNDRPVRETQTRSTSPINRGALS